jgi:four helix bundle protein
MNHKNLDAWKKSIDLVEMIYKLSALFPEEERYGLRSQIRRAAVSVPSNLAEGAARNSKKGFLNFISISLGSLAEVETQVIIAQRLGFCEPGNNFGQINEVRALIIGLRNYLRKSL